MIDSNFLNRFPIILLTTRTTRADFPCSVLPTLNCRCAIMRRRFLHPGCKVELIDHACAIPAGIYTFVRRHDELLVFSVTPQIGFVLASSYWEHLVRPTFEPRQSTCESTFIRAYATRLKLQDSQPCSTPHAAVSMCFMSQAAIKRVTRHLAAKSGHHAPWGIFPSAHDHVSIAA